MPTTVEKSQTLDLIKLPALIYANRKNCMARLGSFILYWNKLEEDIVYMLPFFFSEKGPVEGGYGINLDYSMFNRMSDQISNKSRIEEIRRILRDSQLDSATKHQLRQFRSRFKNLVRIRNDIIHSHWAYCENFPEEIIRLNDENPVEIWSEACFAQLCKDIKILQRDIHRFVFP